MAIPCDHSSPMSPLCSHRRPGHTATLGLARRLCCWLLFTNAAVQTPSWSPTSESVKYTWKTNVTTYWLKKNTHTKKVLSIHARCVQGNFCFIIVDNYVSKPKIRDFHAGCIADWYRASRHTKTAATLKGSACMLYGAILCRFPALHFVLSRIRSNCNWNNPVQNAHIAVKTTKNWSKATFW